VIFSTGVYYQNYTIGFEKTKKFRPLRQWILIEFVSIAGEPIYFYILLRLIKIMPVKKRSALGSLNLHNDKRGESAIS